MEVLSSVLNQNKLDVVFFCFRISVIFPNGSLWCPQVIDLDLSERRMGQKRTDTPAATAVSSLQRSYSVL